MDAPRRKRGRPRSLVNVTVDGEALPLDYMLAVMRDNTIDVVRRDRMAVAAAPYLHAKLSETGGLGKKEQAAIDAGKPDTSTELGAIMQRRLDLAAANSHQRLVQTALGGGTVTFRGKPS